jgi:hypothetical protein
MGVPHRTVLELPLRFGFALYWLQEGKAALFVFDAGYSGTEDFIEDYLAYYPGGNAGTQAASHGLSGAAQGSVHVQYGFAILAGREYAHAGHLVSAVDGQQHRFGRHFMGVAGAHHDLTLSDAAHQYGMSHGYAFVLGEFLNATGEHIAVLKPYHEDPSQPSFR